METKINTICLSVVLLIVVVTAVCYAETIVQVDSVDIDSGYFQQLLDIRPVPDHSAVDAKMVRSRLDELVTGEVLYAEALRLGLDKNPHVRLRITQMLAHVLLEEQVNKPIYESKITDAELQTYYSDHIIEFKRPAQVRLAEILIPVAPDSKPDVKEEKRNLAEQILAEAIASRGRTGFGRILLKYSNNPNVHCRSNTGFFDIRGKPISMDTKLITEAFKLQKIGQTADHIIETTKGYHIIMLTGRQSAIDKPLAEVKKQLTQRIRREKLETARKQYIDKLKAKSQITINDDAIDTIVKEMKQKAIRQQPVSPGSFPMPPTNTKTINSRTKRR